MMLGGEAGGEDLMVVIQLTGLNWIPLVLAPLVIIVLVLLMLLIVVVNTSLLLLPQLVVLPLLPGVTKLNTELVGFALGSVLTILNFGKEVEQFTLTSVSEFQGDVIESSVFINIGEQAVSVRLEESLDIIPFVEVLQEMVLCGAAEGNDVSTGELAVSCTVPTSTVEGCTCVGELEKNSSDISVKFS